MAEPVSAAGVAGIRRSIEESRRAEPRIEHTPDPKPGEPYLHKGVAIDPGTWEPDARGLPPGCAVQPLGVDGDVFYFLDVLGQLKGLDAGKFSQNTINALFMGRQHWLTWAWPQRNKAGAVSGWQAHKARETLMEACGHKGPWNATDKVRGRGAWTDSHGDLLLHLGSRLIYRGRNVPPGEIDGMVYPTRPDLPAPQISAVGGESPADLLLPLLRSWAWQRPEVDPVLLLGWIGAAFLGGALRWRPTVFITGDKGSGKSTLQAIVKGLMGEFLVDAVDTTAAGIYQSIRQDSIAVAVDEAEAESDPRKLKALIKLARAASSGGKMRRGSDSHVGVEFQVHSSFLFSSINAPPLEPQDLSRMALLRLARLPAGQHLSMPAPQALKLAGAAILRRMIDSYSSLAKKFNDYRDMLAECGHDARGQDTFGILLACADVIVGDRWHELAVSFGDDIGGWVRLLEARHLHEYEDANANWLGCLNHLLSVQVESWRNGLRLTPGQLVEDLWEQPDGRVITFEEAQRQLGQAGLGLRRDERGDRWLVVPNQNPLTRKLFVGSKWGGDEGAGVWAGALRQGPRTELWQEGQCKVNGVKSRATLISLAGLYGTGGIMTEEKEG